MSSDEVASRRYRCAACGNLTRFDVISTKRTKAFHHYSLGGQLHISDVETLSEEVESVECRWCGTGSSVVVLEDSEGSAAGSHS